MYVDAGLKAAAGRKNQRAMLFLASDRCQEWPNRDKKAEIRLNRIQTKSPLLQGKNEQEFSKFNERCENVYENKGPL